MLTDLAAVHSESLASANDINSIYELILTTFAQPARAEDRMLCKLLLVGVASLTEPDKIKLSSAALNSLAFHETFAKLCDASSQMVSNLPRFKPFSALLQQTATTSQLTDGTGNLQRPTALKIAFYWSVQSNRGGTIDSTIESLKNAFPGVSRDEWSKIEVVHMATA